MERLKKYGVSLNDKNVQFFLIAVILFWLKTYITYRIEFNLGIDNELQQFLLFINPISSALFFLGLSFLSKKKRWGAILVGIEFIMSFWLYANVVYYRFFNDFITLPVISQLKVNGGQTDSALSLMSPFDVFYFTDTVILILLLVTKRFPLKERSSKKIALVPLTLAIAIFMVNLSLAEADRPELLTRSFDRNYLVKYLGINNFSIYDGIQSTRSSM